MATYSEGAAITPAPPRPETFWDRTKKALGPVAVVLTVIAKFFAKLKFFVIPLVKFLPVLLKTGGTMLITIGFYAAIWGWKFAVGFVLLIFVHECGHLIMARKFGLKVSAPMFIPFMGAFIALRELPRNAWMEACVGIGGPMFGSLGALICHIAGVYFELPLLIALGYSAYFLNLFNLVPTGFLDGGRIIAALSPWLWIPGIVVLGYLGWVHPNFVVWLMILLSIPRIISLFRAKTDQEKRYYEVSPDQRWIMAVLYFGLIAVLLLGMNRSLHTLQDMQIHPRTHPVYQ
ncbi:MAG: site-2 protease family protein [Chthoniobacterales bacterium]